MITELLGPARIDGDRSQRVFDALMRTLAEPGTVRRLPSELDPRVPAPLWLALALADVDVGIHVDDPEWFDLAVAATGARREALDTASLCVLRAPQPTSIARVSVGTPLAPEDGARLAIEAGRLRGNDDVRLDEATHTLSGPGIAGRRAVVIDGLAADLLARMGRASAAAPMGLDTWLFGADGDVMAIPRTTEMVPVPGAVDTPDSHPTDRS